MTVVRKTKLTPQAHTATWQAVLLDKRLDSAQQIAAHLKQQLLTRGVGTPLTLVLPCPLTLAGIYDRGVMEVLDALFELKKQGCQYRVYGLDGDIQLWATQAPKTEQPPTKQPPKKHPKAKTPQPAAIRPERPEAPEAMTPRITVANDAGQPRQQTLIVEG